MKTLLLSCLGTLLALALVVLGLAGGFAWKNSRGPEVDRGDWLVIDLYGALPEYDPPAGPLGQLMDGGARTLTRTLEVLEKARADERVAGLLLKVGPNGAGWASIEELRGAVAALRAAGKPALAWSDDIDLKGLFLASACESIFIAPHAELSLTGVRAQSLHVKRALDKLGIKPQLHQIKDYKAAAELLLREDASEAAKENDRWIIDEFWRLALTAFQAERGLSEAQITAMMEKAVFSPAEAKAGGLIDEALYFDELKARLAARPEQKTEDGALPTIADGEYAKLEREDLDLEGKPRIAVVHAQGSIGGRESRVDPLLGVMMGHESVVADLRAAREDEDVVAIIFRVDSGGGESLASGFIRHEVGLCAAAKPTICSMVDVAASGGYLIAYHASKLVADAFTVTGSIGSISGKFNVRGLHEKLGITHDAVEKGPNADFWSDQKDFTPEQWARFTQDHWRGFNEWLADVAVKRGMSFAEAEALAHGRVWTGTQALENRLVDAVGGFDAALALAREQAGLAPDAKVKLVHYPEAPGLLDFLQDGDASGALSWLAYRYLREDLAETWRLIETGVLVEGAVAVPR
ncbi:hypothetical protein FJ251_05630 [bacterium]|nr:hypothetical protein [bacterium]